MNDTISETAPQLSSIAGNVTDIVENSLEHGTTAIEATLNLVFTPFRYVNTKLNYMMSDERGKLNEKNNLQEILKIEYLKRVKYIKEGYIQQLETLKENINKLILFYEDIFCEKSWHRFSSVCDKYNKNILSHFRVESKKITQIISNFERKITSISNTGVFSSIVINNTGDHSVWMNEYTNIFNSIMIDNFNHLNRLFTDTLQHCTNITEEIQNIIKVKINSMKSELREKYPLHGEVSILNKEEEENVGGKRNKKTKGVKKEKNQNVEKQKE
jgi:hypothetical protein